MKIFVFVGPTLKVEDARAELDATYLPPAAQGDVYRAAQQQPFAIGIVDGYFERLPAVWHKEILWAMVHRIHVFGAASMGALRAAELAQFGMCGVGAIYEGFRSGALTDDDEVTLAHGDCDTGYRAVSVPMVNIRATLQRAEDAGVVPRALRQQFERLAKGSFYPDRSYAHLFALFRAQGGTAEELALLGAAVREHAVDQKRIDAIALLRALRECRERGVRREGATFSFPRTAAWEQLVSEANALPPITVEEHDVSDELLVSEARLTAWGEEVVAKGWKGTLASHLTSRDGVVPTEEQLDQMDGEFRRTNSLLETTDFEDWIAANDLTNDRYRDLLRRRWMIARVHRLYPLECKHVVDELRASGRYATLRQRARHKQMLTEGVEGSHPEPETRDLLSWYFAERLGRPMPNAVEEFLLEHGLPNLEALVREARREWSLVSRAAELR